MNNQNNCDLEPRIYVASLSDYNAGRLHGVWIDCAGKDEAALYAEITDMLARSPEEDAEEFAIHDYEEFGETIIRHYTGVKFIAQLTSLVEEYGEPITIFIQEFGFHDGETPANFENAYCGHHPSFRDFSDGLFDEIYVHDIPKGLRGYIDYAAFAHDLEILRSRITPRSGRPAAASTSFGIFRGGREYGSAWIRGASLAGRHRQ